MIKGVKDIQQIEIEKVGGKALNLIKLSKNGIKVPPFLLIDTSIYKAFLQQRINPSQIPLEEEIKKKIGDTEDSKKICCFVRELIEKAPEILYEMKFFDDLQKEIKSKVNPKKYYSVRSSGVAEDLKDASFAGQMDTILNVPGNNIKMMTKSILKCWSSVFSERAIIYRKMNNFDVSEIPNICVIIQEMVKGVKSSGIIFTADPISNSRNVMAINCSYGLGECIVSGMVNPDNYYIQKTNSNKKKGDKITIINKEIQNKEIMIIEQQEGKVKTIPVPEEKRKIQALPDHKILELAEECLKIENFYDFVPQDIEFAFDKDDKLFILQARPITNLFPIPKEISFFYKTKKINKEKKKASKKPKRVLFCFNNIQVISDPISPFGIEHLQHFLLDQIGVFFQTPESPSSRMLVSRGRIYIDWTDLFKFIGPRIAKLYKGVDPLMGHCFEELFEEDFFNSLDVPELSLSKKTTLFKFFLSVVGKGMFFKSIFAKLEDAEKVRKDINAQFDELENNYLQKIKQAKDSKEKIEAIFKGIPFLPKMKEVGPIIFSGMVGLLFLKMFFINSEDAEKLAIGLLLNSKEMELAMQKLVTVTRKDQKLIKALTEYQKRKNGEYMPSSELLSTFKDFPEFFKQLNIFMETFGCRGLSEIDIFSPRFAEDASYLINFILTHLKEQESDYTAEIEKGKKYAKDIKENYAKSQKGFSLPNVMSLGGWNWMKKKLVNRFVDRYRSVFGSREDPKHRIMTIFWEKKKQILQLIDEYKLTELFLDKKQDLFFLYESEIKHIMLNIGEIKKNKAKLEEIKNLIIQRKKEYAEDSKISTPRVITSDGENIEVRYRKKQAKNLPPNTYAGFGVSSGIVEGKVKIVLDPSKESIEKGEILVAKQIDPAYSALFGKSIAVVSTVGGLFTHGSVVARELGIPGIVGLPNITENLKNGDFIKVDGTKGWITILKRKEEKEKN